MTLIVALLDESILFCENEQDIFAKVRDIFCKSKR